MRSCNSYWASAAFLVLLAYSYCVTAFGAEMCSRGSFDHIAWDYFNSAIMVPNSALATANACVLFLWLGSDLLMMGRDGTTPNTNREGSKPSGPNQSFTLQLAWVKFAYSGSRVHDVESCRFVSSGSAIFHLFQSRCEMSQVKVIVQFHLLSRCHERSPMLRQIHRRSWICSESQRHSTSAFYER